MFLNRLVSNIVRPISTAVRYVQMPFRQARSFMTNNPLTRTSRALRAQGQQLRYVVDVPRRYARKLLPKRFRMAQRSDASEDADMPDVDKGQLRAFERSRSRRRVRGTARKATFTQIHLLPQGGGERTVLHIGSTTNSSFTELILNPGTKGAIQLRFSLVDETTEGAPLMLRLASGPRDTTVTVDNTVAAPEAPVRNGSVIAVKSSISVRPGPEKYLKPEKQTFTAIFEVQLFAYGDLPAVTRVDAAWGTNVGPVRDVNQDAIGIYQHPKAYMFTIADGVGGGFAGEEISAFAAKYLLDVFRRNIKFDHFSWYDIYAKAFGYINAEVRHFVESAPSAAGSTLTSIFIRNWTAYIAHVGDTRLYHLRGLNLRQVTTDHNRDVKRETLTRGGRPTLVTQSVLVKAVGRSDEIEPDIQTLALQPKDMLLLTTDGVTGNVSKDEIFEIMTTKRLSEIPDELIELANSRDNTDNATAIAIEVLEAAYDRDVWIADPEDRIYVGGISGPLRLDKPASLSTEYSVLTRTGCFLLVVLVFAGCVLFSGVQVRRFVAWIQNPAPSSVMVDRGATNIALTPTKTATTDAINDAGTAGTEESVPVGTVTPSPPPTATATLTRTPRPTDTPPPTATITPTHTPIPPTSTPRVAF